MSLLSVNLLGAPSLLIGAIWCVHQNFLASVLSLNVQPKKAHSSAMYLPSLAGVVRPAAPFLYPSLQSKSLQAVSADPANRATRVCPVVGNMKRTTD